MRTRTLLKIALLGVVLAGLGATAGLGAFWWYIVRDLPQINSLQDYKPKLITRTLASDGTEIATLAEERRYVVPIEAVPDHVIQAFIASEDDGFYEHEGLDYKSILRAFWANLMAGGVVEGGSTITQQVAKTFLLTSSRTYVRKLKDMMLARRIESTLAKNDILYLYLNQIYLGSGAYGIEAAARTYFGKSATDLTLAEAAMIVGVVPAPSRWSPLRSPEIARERQERVLRRMLAEASITEEEYRAALDETLLYAEQTTTELQEASKYFTEEVRRWLVARYGEETVLTGGLTITTALDPENQIAAWRAVRKGLRDHASRAGYRGPLRNVPEAEWDPLLEEIAAEESVGPEPDLGPVRKALVVAVDDAERTATVRLGPQSEFTWTYDDVRWARDPNPALDGASARARSMTEAVEVGDLVEVEELPPGEDGVVRYGLYQEPLAEGALLAMDVATGRLTAMVGGYDFDRSQFNRAYQARRQPGSAFKPFIYAEALRHRYTPASIVYDTPMVFEDDFGTWKPQNYSYSFSGPITLRKALASSKNIATIKVLKDIGVRAVIERVEAFGIESELEPNLALALGSNAVSLAEMVRGYGAFPSGGKLLEPVFIVEVRDRDGEVLDRDISLLADPPQPYSDALQPLQPEPVAPEFSAVADDAEGAEPVDREVMASPSDLLAPPPVPPGYALDPQSAYLMVDMMRAVVEEGTGRRVAALRRPIGGKTGTTNDLYDAWFLGYSPSVVAGAWVGYDNAASLGANETGSRTASPIFIDFMREALRREPRSASYPVPPGISFHRIDPATGLLARGADGIFQPFREGTQPTEYASAPGGESRPTRAPRLD